MLYLKGVGHSKTEYTLKEIHEGVCENHIGVRAIANKLLIRDMIGQ